MFYYVKMSKPLAMNVQIYYIMRWYHNVKAETAALILLYHSIFLNPDVRIHPVATSHPWQNLILYFSGLGSRCE